MISLEHPEITRMNDYGCIYEERPICKCASCGGDIFDGEEACNIPFIELMHRDYDCLEGYFSQYNCIATEEIL